MAPSTPWLLAFLLPFSLLQGTQAQPSCRTKADCAEGQFCRLPDGGCVPPGVCQEVPFVCTMDYRPVCGCDGKTYGNRCGAFGAGMSVKVEGECTPSSPASSVPPPTGPTPGQAKEEAGREGGRVRHKRDLLHMEGWASGEETLLLRVEKAISSSSSSSSQEDNGAAAAAAATAAAAAEGVGVVPSQEPQGLLQRRCGSRGLPACLEGEWCDFVDGTCGETDRGGVCTQVRLKCNRMYMPVCGCDGQTHPNACVARAQQVSIRHEGPCPSTEEAGTAATAPAAVERQKKEEEESKTLSLPPPPPSAPVTPPASPSSSTPPSSHSSLTDVWQANGGRGSEGGTACGGLQGKACPTGQACIFPRGTCGAADEMGTCLPPPFICALIYQPVCGCNGQTFSNECYAHASAISVSAQGPCPPPTPANGAAASPALQQDDVSTTHAQATAAAAAAVAAAVAAAEAIANGGAVSPKGGGGGAAAAAAAAAGPAVTQKNVEEEHLRGGGGRRG